VEVSTFRAGNLAEGDGCDDLCVTELGWECDGDGSG